MRVRVRERVEPGSFRKRLGSGRKIHREMEKERARIAKGEGEGEVGGLWCRVRKKAWEWAREGKAIGEAEDTGEREDEVKVEGEGEREFES
ncbi:hypothetical protein J6590_053746 [Homalodisca vitripennis]|nr:hypothetical protein J6590_053746 [Homalodisca vitripennis]